MDFPTGQERCVKSVPDETISGGELAFFSLFTVCYLIFFYTGNGDYL